MHSPRLDFLHPRARRTTLPSDSACRPRSGLVDPGHEPRLASLHRGEWLRRNRRLKEVVRYTHSPATPSSPPAAVRPRESPMERMKAAERQPSLAAHHGLSTRFAPPRTRPPSQRLLIEGCDSRVWAPKGRATRPW